MPYPPRALQGSLHTLWPHLHLSCDLGHPQRYKKHTEEGVAMYSSQMLPWEFTPDKRLASACLFPIKMCLVHGARNCTAHPQVVRHLPFHLIYSDSSQNSGDAHICCNHFLLLSINRYNRYAVNLWLMLHYHQKEKPWTGSWSEACSEESFLLTGSEIATELVTDMITNMLWAKSFLSASFQLEAGWCWEHQ